MSTALLHSLAVDYTTNTYTTTTTSDGSSPVPIILGLAFVAVIIAGTWKVFSKAKQPGWAALIPIFNTLVLLRVVNRPLWWFILLLIPVVNLIVIIFIYNDLSKAFGYDIGMTLLLIFFPFIAFPVLGLGDSKYNAKAVKRS